MTDIAEDTGLLPEGLISPTASSNASNDQVVDLARSVGGDAVLNEGVTPPQVPKSDVSSAQIASDQSAALQYVLESPVISPAWTR